MMTISLFSIQHIFTALQVCSSGISPLVPLAVADHFACFLLLPTKKAQSQRHLRNYIAYKSML